MTIIEFHILTAIPVSDLLALMLEQNPEIMMTTEMFESAAKTLRLRLFASLSVDGYTLDCTSLYVYDARNFSKKKVPLGKWLSWGCIAKIGVKGIKN